MNAAVRSKSSRRGGATAGKARRQRGGRGKAGGTMVRLMASLPVSEHGLQRMFQTLILIAVVLALWGLAIAAGVPQMLREHTASAAAQAGLIVRRVDVRGVERMDEQAIYAAVIAARETPMPLLDLTVIRSSLVKMPWVREARVSRQLPDTLVIDVVERTPHAVLRRGRDHVLIDRDGHQLELVDRPRAGTMLVLSGDGAERRVADLSRLLDLAPALKRIVREAEWIGNRRWNLTFATGQIIALPEGSAEASQALVSFARMNEANRLLGGKVAVFDMRASDRMYLRVPGHADEQAVLAAERKRAAQQAGG
ncbi:FtsQ-type POTRA domain-containing protein [Croceicoccus sp. F390]|uniref:Cell division protein FtsQ n=1 Tax=Croceicoccus esteveae TaxID=3075597 RepID=A0ABU2ZGE2_9SPHN|nr:FtsQ-type POTRA domain-containing protein [Croceicoccus sp. F390]MDT0575649.1 FtsQ-type POTRA domain-containing protein [Croceicoccus sp. F390]